MLNTGFFTCGFHIALISTHLPGVVASCALPATVSAWSLAVISLGNIAGRVFPRANEIAARARLRGARRSRGRFLLAPKTEFTFLLFAAVLGVT